MRPEILFPLFAPVTSLKGVGPRLGKLVERAVGPFIVDLLWHLPVGLIDRRFAPKIMEAPAGAIVTITITVDAHLPPAAPRGPYRVRCRDESGFLTLTFFHAKADWLTRMLPVGATRVISGKIDLFNGVPQMNHPDHIAVPGELELSIEPVYGLTAGLPLKTIRKAIQSALDRTPTLPEWIGGDRLAAQGWPSWRAALDRVHAPDDTDSLDPHHPARLRLAYDEVLADQLALALSRAHNRHQPGRRTVGTGTIRRQILANLPFHLTKAQETALAEIEADLARPERMLRLLQGDVGSGKTIVALLAMIHAVESGSQAALMAPTEILARQHAATLTRLLHGTGVRVALLTGRDKGKARASLLAALADGAIHILIGTHALFQADVVYHDLAVAVIDEQHRFGVEQRVQLTAKGRGVDVLVMTATPIPRTLMLTSYGDLDSSRLAEKPPGRKPVATRLVSLDRLGDVIDGVARVLAQGDKVYWVCPLVEEAETLDLAAVTDRFGTMAELFPGRVGLVHGQMKGTERDAAMEAFAAGPVDLLVATTVIEVGVDVPAATVMVIEHAERFGLAQLHQLRGRIGRGAKPASCLLLYAAPLGETAQKRLKIMRETDDGFVIAEADLTLRGAGDVLGTKQSGLPAYRLADPLLHHDLIAEAHDEARRIIAEDPNLAGPMGPALRILLYLFARDSAVRFLRSG